MLLTSKAAPMPTPTKRVFNRRRKNFINRFFRTFLFPIVDIEIETSERVLSVLIFFMALGVMIAADRIIATPPPFWQHNALILPSWLWPALLFIGIVYEYWGKMLKSDCHRRNGSVFLFVICCMICGPLWLKTPAFSCVAVAIAMWQGVVAVKLFVKCPFGWVKRMGIMGFHKG